MGITYEKALLLVTREIGKHINEEIDKVNTALDKSNEKIAELEKEIEALKATKSSNQGMYKPYLPINLKSLQTPLANHKET